MCLSEGEVEKTEAEIPLRRPTCGLGYDCYGILYETLFVDVVRFV